jgi:hypothetical protein
VRATSADGSTPTGSSPIASTTSTSSRHDAGRSERDGQRRRRELGDGTVVGVTAFASDADATTNTVSYS